MTVSATTRRWSYTGDGTTDIFAYDNKIFADADLTVYVDDTLQTLTTNYTVSGAGSESGGNVTFVTPPADGASVVIIRDIAKTQATDYPAGGTFPAAAHEDALDKLTILIQQVQEEIDRCVKYSPSETSYSTAQLASPVAGRVLSYDAASTRLVFSQIRDLASDVSFADTVKVFDSVSDFISETVTQSIVYIYSYYGGWAATTDGPKGGFFAHKTGATNSSPTVGSDPGVSSIGTGTQAGYFWDADGTEFKISANQPLYVSMFGADNTGTNDSTAAITDAWQFASAVTDAEIEVLWEPGTYDVTQLDYTGYKDIKNVALGTVVIYGTDTTSTYEFIVGCDGYDAGTPANSDRTDRFHWIGRFIFNEVSASATYTVGMKLFASQECKYDGIAVSGNFSGATVDIQFTWSSKFLGGNYTNSNDGSGGTCYIFRENNNNVNNNLYESIRMNGTNDTSDDQVAMRIRGTGENVVGCDISAIKIGIQYDSARGAHFDNNYFEATLQAYDCGSAGTTSARGISITGGYIEVLTSGTGIKTSGAGYGTLGIEISGVRFKGLSGGSSRTAIDLGAQTYHPEITAVDYEDIDTDITGTYRTGGGIGAIFNYPFQISGAGLAKLENSMTVTGASDSGATLLLKFDEAGNRGLWIGVGSPESVVTAGQGSLYISTGGGAGATLYAKESGAGDTGWSAL